VRKWTAYGFLTGLALACNEDLARRSFPGSLTRSAGSEMTTGCGVLLLGFDFGELTGYFVMLITFFITSCHNAFTGDFRNQPVCARFGHNGNINIFHQLFLGFQKQTGGGHVAQNSNLPFF
jgi:hypothetical protein